MPMFKATPLLIATMGSKSKIAQMLIDAGADIHAQDIYGSTALEIAEIKGNKELVNLLKSAGASK